MGPRKRVLALICIMVIVGVIVEGFTIALLYRAAINGSIERFGEIAQNQKHLIESIAIFNDKDSSDNIIHNNASNFF